MDTNFVNELARKLADAVPGAADDLTDGFGTVAGDLERNFRSLLSSAFERMDLVSREEFEVQRKVLERTREKLTELEGELEQIRIDLNQTETD